MKKKILAAALALTMVMPMTVMAAQKPLPPGQSVSINYGTRGEAGEYQYDVVDADTFYATRAWGIGVRDTLRPAVQAVVPADYDIYYVRHTTVKSGSGMGLCYFGMMVDEQILDDGQAGMKWENVVLSETGELANLYNMPAGFRGATQGERWTVTINGQVYDKVMHLEGDIAGSIWIVPKAASSVRALFTGLKSGSATAATNYADMGLPDWDNAYYIDLKTGTNTASAQPQTTQTWVSDASGWRVQNADGSYLTSQWFQYNNQWYYLGADGYMLTNTTTPDGYPVNADGVWVQ